MFQLSVRPVFKSSTQLMVQGLYLLIGILLIAVGVQCLDAEKVAMRHHGTAAPTVCTIE